MFAQGTEPKTKTCPLASKPRRPARPAICWSSVPFKGRSPKASWAARLREVLMGLRGTWSFFWVEPRWEEEPQGLIEICSSYMFSAKKEQRNWSPLETLLKHLEK